jgi:hypothetical protein
MEQGCGVCCVELLNEASRSAHTPRIAPLSASRYENVGMSIFLVALLSVFMTPVYALLYWGLRKARQSCLTGCVQTASQDTYNSAWLGDEFALDYRWGWVLGYCK